MLKIKPKVDKRFTLFIFLDFLQIFVHCCELL